MIFQISIAIFHNKILISGPFEYFWFVSKSNEQIFHMKRWLCAKNQKCLNGPESKILLCWFEKKNTFSPPLFREKILYLVNTNFGLKVSVFVLLQQFVTALGKNCNGYRKNWFLLGILHWITTPNGKYYRVNSKKVPKLSWLAITRAIVKY